MRRAAFLLALVAGFQPGWLALAQTVTPEPKDAGQVSRLITQLGAKHFKDRDAAMHALAEIGTPALPALKKAARGPDAEIRRRAALLVQKIERRQESERLLTPKRIHLVYKDTPVSEAVSDLARRTGFPIVLNDRDRSKLAERKITLDTGETTFWEAFDQFCQKAGLVEQHQDVAGQQQHRVVTDGRGNQVIIVDLELGRQARPENRLVLADGKSQALPTWHAGGVRIRALPPSATRAGAHKTLHETMVVFEVTPEPGLKWKNVFDLQVDRAIDEHGQELVQRVESKGALAGDPDLLVANLLPYLEQDGDLSVGNPHQIGIVLKRGKEPSSRLKEVHGTVAARMETTETLVSVDDLLKSADRSFRGKDGSTLRVTSVREESDGSARVQVQLDTPQPAQAMGAAQFIRANRRIIFLNRNRGTVAMEHSNWSLVDDRGQTVPYHLVAQRVTGGLNGFIQEASFQIPTRARGSKLKLAYTGQHSVTVEVPFTLKDVPLP